MLDAIEAFLTRTYHDHDSDRVLATVLSAQVNLSRRRASPTDAGQTAL